MKETKARKVKSCIDCPFANCTGGGKNYSGGRRLYVSCNLQPNGVTQYRSGDNNYECFKSCPLKVNSILVVLID